MDAIYWGIIIILFIIGFAGLFFPIIPSVIFVFGGILLYGVFFTFEHFGYFFWAIEIVFVALLFIADYAANFFGVKKSGGSKAGVWGSTIGLIVGPFLIPVVGIIAGPFLGAILAELIFKRRDIKTAFKIGLGSVAGFISSVIAKGLIQAAMVGYFLFHVL
ncbi:DUF456 domain-containing protein [Peribacillus kribbensis]|uniref:DUF456 domain-containing protein n=1 Tax=Peribacillus kribbensis TaxID=356658 RepID=UPI00041D8723|nr:DUF456 domain-containing protein [Peribacillus kribbensis]